MFKKDRVSSRDFPVILFDAGGVILHYQPRLERFYRDFCLQNGLQRSDQEVDSAFVSVIRTFNERAEADPLCQLKSQDWYEEILLKLKVSDEERKTLKPKLADAFSSQVKVTASNSTIDILQQLKDRGYRLGLISNWAGPLADILRAQDILDFFESVITSSDVGFAKPHPKIFEAALEDLSISSNECIFVGESYATDVMGARQAAIPCILYDPQFRELRALNPQDVSQKVVSLEALKQNRRIQDVKIIARFEELLEFFV